MSAIHIAILTLIAIKLSNILRAVNIKFIDLSTRKLTTNWIYKIDTRMRIRTTLKFASPFPSASIFSIRLAVPLSVINYFAMFNVQVIDNTLAS